MNIVYYAHSGLRYLILLAGLAAVVLLARGLSGKLPYGKGARVATAMYTGSMHLQVLGGILLVVLGRWYPALMGHLTLNLLAVIVATVAGSWARREADAGKAYKLAFGGVVLSLLLLVGGIASIGRHPFESRAADQLEAELR
jgi:hypothetical protein